jgi:response regulator RpfG family c-di-GMP phosphodiesterase
MIRALIVDAAADMRQLLTEWLESAGVSIIEVSNADEAIGLFARGAPEVVFCDTQLTLRDGIWLADRLRERFPETAVVVMTALHDVLVAESAFRAGAVDYLVKPFSRERTLEALRRAREANAARVTSARLTAELETQRRELFEALAEVELSTATLLDTLITARHPGDSGAPERAQRIARLAINLALTLEVREPQLSDIERAAFLYDVRGLTPTWRRSLATLAQLPRLAGAVRIALAAHERADARGVVEESGVTDTPLGARILAAAEAFDELVRPPRQLSPREALERLRTRSAAAFDAAVLGALDLLLPSAGLAEPEDVAHAAAASPPEQGTAVAVMDDREGEDPRRRWRRRRVAPGMPVRLGGQPAQLVEVSYGGFRVESAAPLDATPASAFVLEIMELDVSAEIKWMVPSASGGRCRCGAQVSGDESRAGSRWRAVVDAFPLPPHNRTSA